MNAQKLRKMGNSHEVNGIQDLHDGKIYHALLNFSVAMHCYREAGELTDSEDCRKYIFDLIERHEFSEIDRKAFYFYGREKVKLAINKSEYLGAIVDGFSVRSKPENPIKRITMITDFPVYKNLRTRYIGERKNFN